MSDNGYELTEKQRMLGMALYAKRLRKDYVAAIMMTLEGDDQIDDMTWYIGQNPQATADELLAVAYQIAKEARDNG